ncbi:epithelial membrane protein 1-like isoform X2 [Ptychodera flava]|uniref:epithelial membrane protein 1-like isoform X2 n=1 Tax=Ptychodera flava TaxID=63121 RepID=UPI00396AAA7D
MGSPILPFIGIGLTVLAVLFYIIATATNAWASHRGVDSTADLGLWKSCYGSTCDTLGFILTNADAIYVSRFAMITAILVAVGALIIPLLVFFKKLQKKLVKVSAGLIIGTVFKEDRLTEYGYGYSIILAWLSIPIAIAGGVLILLGGLETPVKFMENDVALA